MAGWEESVTVAIYVYPRENGETVFVSELILHYLSELLCLNPVEDDSMPEAPPVGRQIGVQGI